MGYLDVVCIETEGLAGQLLLPALGQTGVLELVHIVLKEQIVQSIVVPWVQVDIQVVMPLALEELGDP